MRGVVMLGVAAACAAHAAEPLPAPEIARGEVSAPPIPPFGGIDRTGPCAVHFRPAADDERRERTTAYLARLPRGARVELSRLGDRAGRVTLPIDPARLVHTGRTRHPDEHAARLAGEALRDTAELWGFPREPSGAPPWRVGDAAPDGHAWAFEIDQLVAGPDQPETVRVVVRVDPRRRTIDLALGGQPLPAAEVCAGPRPTLDGPRLIAAVLARPHQPPIRAADVGAPEPILRIDGDDARWVAVVPLGDDLASPQRDLRGRVSAGIWIDPTTAEVIEERPVFENPIDDVYYLAADDADHAFGKP